MFERLKRVWTAAALSALGGVAFAQGVPSRPAFDAFEEATIKPTHPGYQISEGRLMAMQSTHRFIAQHYTLKALIAAAFGLSPVAVAGGPEWIDRDRFDIVALTPADVRPSQDEQMGMLRELLARRFALTFHRERKILSIYALAVTTDGPKLKLSTAAPDDPAVLVNRMFPDRILLPARNATVAQFASLLQRVVVDRPVSDETRLSGRYDFDLEWAPNNSQFGGQGPPETAEPAKPGIFTALQEQLGLRLQSRSGQAAVLVVDRVERPSAN